MKPSTSMQILPQHRRAAGLDMHKDLVCACFYVAGEVEEVREYHTFTCDLERVRDDLLALQINHVLMESTGVYWIALCAILTSAGITVHVVNARFVKNMPKEKTDRKDARWLCKLLVNNQIRDSFVVGDEQRAFRDLCRMRIKYTQHISQAQNRIVKNLERRNIKLRSVVSSMDTLSAMSIVAAIAGGESDIEKLVALCKGKLKKKCDDMRKALHGVISRSDRSVLQRLLADIAHYKKQIADIEKEISVHTEKVSADLIKNLREVKGVGKDSTEVILAEVGSNVDAFASPDKLAAWCGLAPGNNESADKRRYSSTRDGNKHIKTIMTQVAWAAVRTRNSYWRALYYHLVRRMPPKKAIIAIARKLIRLIYKIIKGTKTYVEYGAEYFMMHLAERQADKRSVHAAPQPT